jgi:preprotein translocase subunit SecG
MWFTVVLTIIAVLLIISVLIQARGTGLGASFGGDGGVFRTKRGIEKKLQGVTVILAVLFLGLSLANLFI